jgi:hypothetical protein
MRMKVSSKAKIKVIRYIKWLPHTKLNKKNTRA